MNCQRMRHHALHEPFESVPAWLEGFGVAGLASALWATQLGLAAQGSVYYLVKQLLPVSLEVAVREALAVDAWAVADEQPADRVVDCVNSRQSSLGQAVHQSPYYVSFVIASQLF